LHFDLTDMQVFLTVVEHGSLTKGAQALHLALASVSERISGMESMLGAALLERSARGVVPTAAGQTLVRNARLVLAQVEQLRGELRGYATGLKGRIKLLSNTGALVSFLPQQLRRFLIANPDLSIDLIERPSAEIVLSVAEGRADLGLVANVADFAALETHLVAQDRLVVVASRSHAIAGRSGVHFAEIVDEAFVGVSDAALDIYLSERASRLGCQLHYRIQLRSLDCIATFVDAGIGIAILPEASARALAPYDLAVLPLMEPWATRQLHLCARRFSSLTPHAGLLAQELLSNSRSAVS
jgi:DNA-binding transcriptional LysR family regulator